MKKIYRLSLFLATATLLSGCFKDEGNYNYDELMPPKWLYDVENTNIYVAGRAGADETVHFKASDMFTWEANPEQRKQEVRYEWRLNDILIGEDVDFTISSDELMKKLNWEEPPAGLQIGTFHIIEKKNDVTFMGKFRLNLQPEFSAYDWLILSADNGSSKLSSIKYRTLAEGEYKYELLDDAYALKNGSSIPGNPVKIRLARALNVSPLGSATIITDQVAYELNSGNLMKVWELKDRFPDGVPPDFEVADRRDQDGAGDYGEGAYTFVATKDGRVFSRVMAPYYVGGEFLSEPYFVDNKGYHITRFGHSTNGLMNIPCYDEKNRRGMVATAWRVDVNMGGGPFDTKSVWRTRLIPMRKLTEDGGGVPIWEMPEDSKVWHITQANHLPWFVSGTNVLYDVYYTDAGGRSIVGSFVISNMSEGGVSNDYFAALRWHVLQNARFDEETLFLTSASGTSLAVRHAKFTSFYTKGHEIRYLRRSESYDGAYTDNFFMELPSKVTMLTYDWYDYRTMLIGCDNGDVYIYDVNSLQNPRLIEKFNVGGRVVSAAMLGFMANRDFN